VDPAALGIARGTTEGLRGRDAAYNADVVRRLLGGETGPVRDAVMLNAGAALAVHASAEGDLHEQLAAGITRAEEAVDSGSAAAVLDRWVAASR
jgi:anthranilate phosphoribosyltransferase